MPQRGVVLFFTFFIASFLYLATHVQWRTVPAQPLPSWRHSLAATNFTVNLVLATLKKDDISWTSKLDIPNLTVIRYVSDDPTAQYRPPVPRKGREATIYHTYFYDFYDDLPDLSIMIHAEENPWHIEGVLQQSMLFALSRLDLERAHQRGYSNLRANWENACPSWIDTSKTEEESDKQEEPYMREAFQANFGPLDVPRFLGGPCCSQFAVSRGAVRQHPRSQYKRSLDWMVDTKLSDYIAGRTWEHMFPWLFRGAAVDCPDEANTYCAMYGVCFEHAAESTRYNKLWQEKRDLMEATELGREILNPQEGVRARRRMAEIDVLLREQIIVALERGRNDVRRSEAFHSLFST